MAETCAAGYPLGNEWLICGAPAVAVHDYACVHEHVRRWPTCEEHQPRPGMVGCRSCFEAGHECEMTPRLVTEAGT